MPVFLLSWSERVFRECISIWFFIVLSTGKLNWSIEWMFVYAAFKIISVISRVFLGFHQYWAEVACPRTPPQQQQQQQKEDLERLELSTFKLRVIYSTTVPRRTPSGILESQISVSLSLSNTRTCRHLCANSFQTRAITAYIIELCETWHGYSLITK